jgi:hypothetical protein
VLEGKVPDAFTRVIRSGDQWTMRRLDYHKEDRLLFCQFLEHAKNKQGSEWTKDDLKIIVGCFYSSIPYREWNQGRRALLLAGFCD